METGLPTIILLLLFGLVIASFISQQLRYMMASVCAFVAAIIMFIASYVSIPDSPLAVGEIAHADELEIYAHRISTLKTENEELARTVKDRDLAIQKLKLPKPDEASLASNEKRSIPLVKSDKNTPKEIKDKRDKSSGMSALLQLVLGEDKAESAKDIVWDVQDFNCRLVLNSSEIKKLPARLVNEDAHAAWKYKKSKGFGVLIAENSKELGLSKEDLDKSVLLLLESSSSEYKRVKTETIKSLAGEFKVRHYKVKMGRLRFYYIISTMGYNGYYYQISSWTMDNSGKSARLIEDVRKALGGFTITDPSRIAPSTNLRLAESFADKKFGLFVTNPGFYEFYDLATEKDSLPNYGFYSRGHGVLVYSVYVPEHISKLDILRAYSELFHLSETLPKERIETRTVDGVEITSVILDYVSNEGACHSKLELVRNGNRACILRTWGWKNEQLVKTDSVWENLTWKSPEAKNLPEELSDSVKVSTAKLVNQVGLEHYTNRDYLRAYKDFKLARSLDNTVDVYVTNMIESQLKMGKNREALKLADSAISQSAKPSQEIKKYKARVLYLLGEMAESELVYRDYFSEATTQDDDAMRDYLSVLLDQEKMAAAEDLATAYYKKFPAIKTQKWKALLQYRNENYVESERTYKKILSNEPTNSFAFEGLVDTCLATDNTVKARDWVEQWIAKVPDDIDAKLMKVKVMKLSNKKKEAYAYLKRLSEDAPDEKQLKLALAQMSSSLGLGDHSLITKAITPVSMSEELAASLAGAENIEKEYLDKDAVYLHHLTLVNVGKSGEVKKTIRRKCKIINHNGVERHSKLEVAFYPRSDQMYVNSVKVYGPDGKLSYEGKVEDYYITDKDKDMATDEKTLHIPIKSLAIGSTYEVIYTESNWKYKDRISFDNYWFVASDPMSVCAVECTGDLHGVDYYVTNEPTIVTDSENSKLWVRTNVDGFKSESYSPDSHHLYTRLSVGSSSKTWADISSEYYQHISSKIASHEEVKELVKRIVKPGFSSEEKAKAVILWVQNNITYQAIEFGPRGRMPKSSQTTMRTREGDCKDMSLLLCHMLREVGVEAYLALANTNANIAQTIPDEDQFNHILVYCPQLENRIIDPTNSNLNLYEYPPIYSAGDFILPVTESGVGLYKIPLPKRAEISFSIDRHVSSSETELMVKETAVLRGYSAAYFRRALAGKNGTQVNQYFTNYFSYSYPDLNLKTVTINSDIMDNFSPLSITIHSKMLKDESNTKVPMVWESQYYQLSKLIDRRNPLTSELRIAFQTVTSFDDKDLYKFDLTDLDSKYVNYSSKIADGKLVVKSTTKLCTGSASEYEKLRVEAGKLIPKIMLK